MFEPSHYGDFVVNDSPFMDFDHPPEHWTTHFMSQGSAVHTELWLAQGAGAKGCVIVTPQMYGGDSLDSLFPALYGSGIHVMKFLPRGMWDDQHVYTLSGALDDLHAAVDFVRSLADKQTPSGNTYRIDPDRIAALGLSGGGGNVSVGGCAENDHIKAAVGVCTANVRQLHPTEKNAERIAEITAFMKSQTAGRIDFEAVAAAMSPADIDRVDIIKQAEKLKQKKLLLVGASHDLASPADTCHRRFANALRDAGAQNLTDVVFETDHMFMTKRLALARLVIAWLRTECEF